MTRILALNASHRGDSGHCRYLIDRLFRGATAAGAECETITLADHKISRCLGCETCQTPNHRLRCVFDGVDDVRAIFAKMADADIVVYATPIYIFTISSLLKSLLERMNALSDTYDMRVSKSGLVFHHVDRATSCKPFVTIVCCSNIEDESPRNALSYFKTFSRFMDAPQVGGLVRNGGRLAGHGEDPTRQIRLPKLRDVYSAYEQAGRELAVEGRIRRATERRANQEIVPVPLFGLLKGLPFRFIKKRFCREARAMAKH